MADKDLDIVVFGATGVTGRRVAAYLASRAPELGLRWAAAARDAGKLARLLAAEGVSAPETIVADVGDSGSLESMAARTRVVLDLVGPYALYGRPVVSAAVAGGAHYADLTGEMPFVRRTIDEFDAPAAAAGVKVVQCCGFESLPPDLAVRLAVEAARDRGGDAVDEVELLVRIKPPPGRPRASDGISGGTFQTIVAALGDEDGTAVTDPAALITDSMIAAAVRRRSPISLAPRRGAAAEVIAPMLPIAYINPAVIQRTATLLADRDDRPGEPFRYREGVVLDGGPVSLPARLALAGALSGMQTAVRAGMRAQPSVKRRLSRALERLFPASGYGPEADRLEGWEWTMSVEARTARGDAVGVEVVGLGHPGYLATARMLGEAGVVLAQGGATPRTAGCLTPAAALGTGNVDQFARAGLRFTVSA